MNERGAPTPVAWTKLRAPQSRMGPADAAVMTALVEASPLQEKYAAAVDRDSAREMLARRLEAGAARAEAEEEEPEARPAPRTRRSRPSSSGSSHEDRDGMVVEALRSRVAQDFMRTAAREIARGVFRIGRR